ncbi:hypothetical protein [Immundisolibacter sp.]
MQRTDLVFWHLPTNARVPSVIDAVMIDDQGAQRGLYSGETLDELASRYHEPKVADIADFMTMQESALRTQPEPSTEEHYTVALECLPPHDWRRVRGVEPFKMVERLSGRMTRIYAKKGDSYWTFVDRDDLSAEAIATKIEGAMQ